MITRGFILRTVKLNWKTLRMALLASTTGLMVVGCGGLTASPSVSPLSFFLPGLVQNKPAEDKANQERVPAVVVVTGAASESISQ
jgi:hypothetical protein